MFGMMRLKGKGQHGVKFGTKRGKKLFGVDGDRRENVKSPTIHQRSIFNESFLQGKNSKEKICSVGYTLGL